jgi:hypothetical protein
MPAFDATEPDRQEEEPQWEEAYLQGSGTARMVYRAMREAPAGGPMIGPTARTLGVRPNVDIPLAAGQVQPNTGGMSVAPDSPTNLHPLRRPPAHGGLGKDPIWAIRLDQLGGDLQFRQDSPTHGLIEPARDMSLDDLQQALAQTRPYWVKLP